MMNQDERQELMRHFENMCLYDLERFVSWLQDEHLPLPAELAKVYAAKKEIAAYRIVTSMDVAMDASKAMEAIVAIKKMQ